MASRSASCGTSSQPSPRYSASWRGTGGDFVTSGVLLSMSGVFVAASLPSRGDARKVTSPACGARRLWAYAGVNARATRGRRNIPTRRISPLAAAFMGDPLERRQASSAILTPVARLARTSDVLASESKRPPMDSLCGTLRYDPCPPRQRTWFSDCVRVAVRPLNHKVRARSGVSPFRSNVPFPPPHSLAQRSNGGVAARAVSRISSQGSKTVDIPVLTGIKSLAAIGNYCNFTDARRSAQATEALPMLGKGFPPGQQKKRKNYKTLGRI